MEAPGGKRDGFGILGGKELGDPTEPVAPFHKVKEVPFKLFRVPRYNPVRVLPEDLHLTLVRFAHAMALESVFVSALLLAHLTVPSQLLETFGFDSIGDCFGG
ncbi:hypothetical protein J1N35_036397 [Gossypium stocksii]|uniref:Uncharacterized protein n=1 Tax=Gossypium stocksii TaxID=47602 RepID=A0A9D3UI15_9ROSI|nr:hypothetical protein J1N35_036397 [Gossypium stocksii]